MSFGCQGRVSVGLHLGRNGDVEGDLLGGVISMSFQPR